MKNWLPKSQGPMRIRPGMQYIGSSINDTGAAWIDFVAATNDTALLEITDIKVRVWISDVLLARPAVASIANFAADTGLWQDKSANGGTIAFGDTGSVSGDTGLILNAVNYGGVAKATRKVAIGAGEVNVEHALAINVVRGPVTFRCGNDTGDDTYIKETPLRTGRHSLSFTPTAAEFHLTFLSSQDVPRIVASIAMDTGTMELVAPWDTADLATLRWAQSADVVFVWADGYQQRRIERRGTGRSWSLVRYQPDNGPFSAGRTNDDVRLRVYGTRGLRTMQADKPFFVSGHVGGLFRLFHEGYNWSFNLGRDDTWTDPIRVTGLQSANADQRTFVFTISGTWTATINLHVSDSKDAGYKVTSIAPRSGATQDITANSTNTYDALDESDNLIEYFRVGIESGNYTSGTANIKVVYQGNGDYGIVRVVSVTNSTTAVCEVLRSIGDSGYTEDWREGAWSTYRGFPTAGALYEGRLWHAGGSKIQATVSDDYDSFDEAVTGDAGPIDRTFGEGPVDNVNFLLPLGRLIAGTAGSEIGVHSTSFDEPITPTNMQARDISTNGSLADLRAVKIDKRGVFAQRAGERVFELFYNAETSNYDTRELTLLHPELARGNIVTDIAVQRQPDTRIHFVLADGTVAILTYEPQEELICWSRVITDTGTASAVEKVVVLPGTNEDAVYYHVKRTINGATKRFLEKWAMETQCEGGSVCRLADSFKTFADTGTTVSGFTHLAGNTGVIVWGDSGPVMDTTTGLPKLHTVSAGGVLTLAAAITDSGMAGLPYIADYKSTKLAYAAAAGTALTQRKRLNQVAIIARKMHNKAIRIGRDFDNLTPLPDFKDGTSVANTVHSTYDIDANAIRGDWNTDHRLCIRAYAGLPVELLAAIISLSTHDN